MRNAKLAALTTRYDDATGTLHIARNGVPEMEASLKTESGRAALEYFFQEFMGGEARGALRVLESPGHSFSDVAAKVVHIVNMDSVADLGLTVGRDLHPVRFRANLYLRGWDPWSELELIGREIRAGGVTLKVTKRVVRCAATEVNPDTAERDVDVPDAIWRKTGSNDLGIYASVIAGGLLAENDPVEIL